MNCQGLWLLGRPAAPAEQKECLALKESETLGFGGGFWERHVWRRSGPKFGEDAVIPSARLFDLLYGFALWAGAARPWRTAALTG